MTPGGIMVTDREDIEPIVPMGALTEMLDCKVQWEKGKMSVLHPCRGLLPVREVSGCPQVSKALALSLIEEMEDKVSRHPQLKALNLEVENQWLKDFIESHPVCMFTRGFCGGKGSCANFTVFEFWRVLFLIKIY